MPGQIIPTERRSYAIALQAIKTRIQATRLRVVLSANSAMVQLYWNALGGAPRS